MLVAPAIHPGKPPLQAPRGLPPRRLFWKLQKTHTHLLCGAQGGEPRQLHGPSLCLRRGLWQAGAFVSVYLLY